MQRSSISYLQPRKEKNIRAGLVAALLSVESADTLYVYLAAELLMLNFTDALEASEYESNLFSTDEFCEGGAPRRVIPRTSGRSASVSASPRLT